MDPVAITTAPVRLQPKRFGLRLRIKAALIHFCLSFSVAAVTALIVFGLWYPGPYRAMSGGQNLFFLVTVVDVVMGPLLTFVVFNDCKGVRQLRLDLACIAVAQTAALAYGLHTMYLARPIAMVFEVDRFRVLTTGQIETATLAQARAEYVRLPLTGPWLLGTREPRDVAERNEALFMAIRGIDVGQRPTFWQPYAESRQRAIAKARPFVAILTHYPERRSILNEQLRMLQIDPTQATFIPVTARGDWVAILDRSGQPVKFLPIDGFF